MCSDPQSPTELRNTHKAAWTPVLLRRETDAPNKESVEHRIRQCRHRPVLTTWLPPRSSPCVKTGPLCPVAGRGRFPVEDGARDVLCMTLQMPDCVRGHA